MFLNNNKIRPLITRSWLGQTLYLLSLLPIKAPTHTLTHTHNQVNSYTLKHTEREREDEWRGEGGVCDWSFGLHSIMAYQAPAPTWVHCKSYSSRYKSVPLSLSLSLEFVSACKWHVLSLNKIYLNLLILLEFLSFLINFVKKLPLKNIFRKKSVIIKIFI